MNNGTGNLLDKERVKWLVREIRTLNFPKIHSLEGQQILENGRLDLVEFVGKLEKWIDNND